MTPILYLHGYASSPASSKACHFRALLDAAGARVTVPDLTEGDFEHLTISGQLRLIERLAEGRPVSLVGSSMGGYLAALYASTHPEVERLVLLAPAFEFARCWVERLGPEQMDAWRRAGSLEVFNYALNGPALLSHELLDDALTHPGSPSFPQPALIFHGTQDDVVPVAFSETFAAGHPNVRLFQVESGHDLHNVLDAITDRAIPFLLGERTTMEQ